MENTPLTPLERGMKRINPIKNLGKIFLQDMGDVLRAMKDYITKYEKHAPNPSQEGNRGV